MAVVRVSFDDAVLGRMPDMCAKTGGPADRLVTVRARVDGYARRRMAGFQAPSGGIPVLEAWALSRYDADYLSVQVPWSTAAQRHLDRVVLRWRIAWWVILAATVVVVGTLMVTWRPVHEDLFAWPLLALVVLMTGGWLSGRAVRRARVGATVDTERRWVTLRRVHRNFAAAVEAARAGTIEPLP